MAIRSVNPTTGEVIAEYEALSEEAVRDRIGRSWAAFEAYRRTEMEDRSRWVAAAAEELERRKSELARLMTTEMGKPIAASVAEVEKCAWGCRYYAEAGASFLQDEEIATDAQRSYVRYAPLGPVLAVMPWNFPLWQVFRFAAPALMAGNTGLLKHASNVPGCALAIAEVFRSAGFPDDVFQTLLIEPDGVSTVLDDPRVRAATLTGSTRAGSAVAERAGKRIKKTVLELGGSDPFVVMPSADIEAAAATAVTARTINNGQSCIAAKRFIVHSKVYDGFRDHFVAGLERLRVGDPLEEGTQVGPLATPAILDEVARQVERTVAAGATVLTGGERLPRPGNFYAPTALENVPTDSPARTEEIFGPVATLMRVESLEEAIEVANETVYGLGSSVWTNDDGERDALISGMDAGLVFVNAMVASDPRLPFGGVKESGYGRELGYWGIREFVNIQTVWIGGQQKREAE